MARTCQRDDLKPRILGDFGDERDSKRTPSLPGKGIAQLDQDCFCADERS